VLFIWISMFRHDMSKKETVIKDIFEEGRNVELDFE
jgi:hypothetical protein